jgi:ribulose-phosphate 3-epimerase
MVKDVKKYVDEFKDIHPEYMTFHIEVGNTKEYINYIKENHIKVGLSIKPDTKLDNIYPFLPYIDLVLIMSVEPGSGGQAFIDKTFTRIDTIYQYREENNLSFKIEVDGGVKDTNVGNLKKCDIVVIGSYITNGNYQENVKKIRDLIQ